MKNAVLVLTNSEDGKHTDVVIEKLQRANQNVFRFDSDRFANGDIVIDFKTNDHGCGFIMRFNDRILNSQSIKSVWYRRPNHFNLQIKDSIQRRYVEEEMQNLLAGLWAIIPNAFWLSNPRGLEQARKKLFQLKLAREIGFLIPETIVTNSPNRVRKFFKNHNAKIVFKAIYHEFLNYGNNAFNIPTTLITERHLASLELVRKMPALFQKFIEKKYELRVTIVEDKIFAVRIDSQVNPLTVVDWRHPEYIDKLSYVQVKFPRKIANLCLRMLTSLGLVFGAFDFVMSKDGKLYFLEVNPNGQWYWIEDLTGISISSAIANTLSKERR